MGLFKFFHTTKTLEEDIELDVLEGFDLRVCLNGFKHRESVSKTKTVDGVETVVGSITYYNCTSSASPHKLSG